MAAGASPMNRGGFSQLLSRDFDNIAMDNYAQPAEEFSQFCNVTTMDGAYIKEGELAGLSVMQQVGEGEPIPYDGPIARNDKTVYASKFGLAVAITEEMYDDDRSGHVKKMFAELGKAAAYTRELLAADLLNSAFSSSVRTGIDAHELCYATHPLIGGGTFSNVAGTSSALTMTTMQAGLDVFETMKNERGVPRPTQARLLVVPVTQRWKAEELLKSEYNPENANQQVNTVGNKGLNFMVNHYLTSTTAWFLLADKAQHDLRFIWRKKPQTMSWDDKNTGNALFKISMRIAATFFDWRGVYGNAGA